MELFSCSHCHKKFYLDGFNNNRLGIRMKTCKECFNRRQNNKCEHKKRRNECVKCGGSQICQHKKKRSHCIKCGGSQICQHKKQRRQCFICDPASSLMGRVKSRIRDSI
jgi:hypothetical protein